MSEPPPAICACSIPVGSTTGEVCALRQSVYTWRQGARCCVRSVCVKQCSRQAKRGAYVVRPVNP